MDFEPTNLHHSLPFPQMGLNRKKRRKVICPFLKCSIFNSICTATNVLRLENMIDPTEIEKDEEYRFVYEDIKQEATKCGKIRSMIIPRRKDGYDIESIGTCYIEYEDTQAAALAKRAIEVKIIFIDQVALIRLQSIK